MSALGAPGRRLAAEGVATLRAPAAGAAMGPPDGAGAEQEPGPEHGVEDGVEREAGARLQWQRDCAGRCSARARRPAAPWQFQHRTARRARRAQRRQAAMVRARCPPKPGERPARADRLDVHPPLRDHRCFRSRSARGQRVAASRPGAGVGARLRTQQIIEREGAGSRIGQLPLLPVQPCRTVHGDAHDVVIENGGPSRHVSRILRAKLPVRTQPPTGGHRRHQPEQAKEQAAA